MSGEWIKMRHDLSEDPAVVSIATKTGLTEFAVVGALHWLWSWADKHCVDCNARSVTAEWIDRKVGTANFGQAMVDAGWLIRNADGVTFPNFERHNGETAKKRAVTNKRVSDHREMQRNGNADDNAPIVTGVTPAALHKALPEEEEEEEEEKSKIKHSPATAVAAKSRFEEFWSAYPTKVGKKPCATKWKLRKLDRVADVILRDVRRRIADDRKWRDGYVPNPETYLNQERWNDGDSAGVPAAGGKVEKPDWLIGAV